MRAAISLAAAACMTQAAVASELGDVERGERLFAKCRSCHQVGEGAKNRTGPQLNNLFGRRAGTAEGYSFSKAFERAGSKGLEWHAETLDTYLENPKALVPGTRMTFAGFDAPQDRADVIAYLRGFSASPANYPGADPTARQTDHDVDPAILALEGDPEYGEYLSSECKTCHQTSGADKGIPPIVHLPRDTFVAAMHAYKDKARKHPVMNMLAGRLGNEEIAALAAYFATLED
ncbi:MAG: c-type cytochrome [Rhodobiaceae bacterium]|nr:c-type cytochrome [Rhodobiaceae bacterium]